MIINALIAKLELERLEKLRGEERVKEEEFSYPQEFDQTNGGSWEALLMHSMNFGAKVQLYNGYAHYWTPGQEKNYSDFQFHPARSAEFEMMVRQIRSFMGKYGNYLNYKMKPFSPSMMMYYRVRQFQGAGHFGAGSSGVTKLNLPKSGRISEHQAKTLIEMEKIGKLEISFDAPKERKRFETPEEIERALDFIENRDYSIIDDKKIFVAGLSVEEKEFLRKALAERKEREYQEKKKNRKPFSVAEALAKEEEAKDESHGKV